MFACDVSTTSREWDRPFLLVYRENADRQTLHCLAERRLLAGNLKVQRTFFLADVTRILNEIHKGNQSAASELLPLIYDELRRLANSKLRKEKAGQTLQPTALVHEAYMRLVNHEDVQWDGRSHFFGAAAEAMRRILVDNARRKMTTKHGGAMARRDLEDGDAVIELDRIDQLLDLDAALTKLAEQEPDIAKLVELRYFAGLTVEDAAHAMEVSPRTVKRQWAYARAWLGRELEADQEDGPPEH